MDEKLKKEIVAEVCEALHPLIEKSVKTIHTMSPDTKSRFEQQDIKMDRILEMSQQAKDHQKEYGRMTTEMYTVWTNSGKAVKVIQKFFIFVGIVTGGIIGIIELIKYMFKK
jgi:hypothetical protein